MKDKISSISISLILLLSLSLVQDLEALVVRSNHQPQRNPTKLNNNPSVVNDDGSGSSLSSTNDLLIMVPSNINLTTDLNDPKSNLFKLNPDVLMDKLERDGSPASSTPNHEAEGRALDARSNQRESRRMNFFKGIWNKPKISPLYLVNGTVCRFVNSSPICTTLTTTGILPNNTPSNPNNNNLFNNQDNQGQNVRFQNNGQQQGNNLRPSALLDDESQDINVESSNDSPVDGNTTSSSARPLSQSASNQANTRPVNVNRRPMNLLSIRRPMRKA